MGGKSTPDYGGLAAQQGQENEQANMDSIYANRPNQFNPFGYTSWQSNPYTDASGNETTQWTQTTGLTPELQDLLNQQLAIQGGRSDIAGMLTGRLGSEYGQGIDYSGMNPMGQVPTAQYTLPEGDIGDPNAFRQYGEDMRYAKSQSRLDPQFAGQREQLEAKMLGQGLTPQDAQWKSQMNSLGSQETDAYNQARYSAAEGGIAESQNMWNQLMGQNQNNFQQALGANNQNWNQSMQGSQYANQIRQQQMTEAMQKRGFNLNEINALMSGGQVGMPSMPSFVPAGAAQTPDYVGAGAAQSGAQNANSPWGGLMGLAGTLGAGWLASDRRLKTNIRRIGTRGGYPWYSYNLKHNGSAHEGVMADEIPQEFTIDLGGYKAVNYGALFGEEA